MDITNRCEIRVIGLQRSGNHALINWLMQLCKGKICFLNNVKSNENPFFAYTELDFKNINPNRFSLENEQKGAFMKKDYLIYSYEENPIQELFNEDFEKNHDKFLGKSAKRFDVLVLRDPYNYFASRLKLEEYGIIHQRYHLTDEKTKRILIGMWKDYAKEYLNYTNYLKYNKVVITYNRWFQNKNYKKELASKLGLKFKDVEDKFVSKYGPGSSFDKRKFDGKASEMKVLDRWQYFKDYSFFRSIFKDKELLELSDRIFGEIEGTEYLFQNQGLIKKAFYNARFRGFLLKGRFRFYGKKILNVIK